VVFCTLFHGLTLYRGSPLTLTRALGSRAVTYNLDSYAFRVPVSVRFACCCALGLLSAYRLNFRTRAESFPAAQSKRQACQTAHRAEIERSPLFAPYQVSSALPRNGSGADPLRDRRSICSRTTRGRSSGFPGVRIPSPKSQRDDYASVLRCAHPGAADAEIFETFFCHFFWPVNISQVDQQRTFQQFLDLT